MCIFKMNGRLEKANIIQKVVPLTAPNLLLSITLTWEQTFVKNKIVLTSAGYKVAELDPIWSLNLTSQQGLFPMSHVGTTADSSFPKNALFCDLLHPRTAQTNNPVSKIIGKRSLLTCNCISQGGSITASFVYQIPIIRWWTDPQWQSASHSNKK